MKMTIFNRNFIFYAIPFFSIMTLITILYFSLRMEGYENRVTLDANIVAASIGESSKEIILSNNHILFNDVLHGYLKSRKIHSITIYDRNDNIISFKEIRSYKNKTFSEKLSFFYKGTNKTIGEYTIYNEIQNVISSTEEIKQEAKLEIGRVLVKINDHVAYSHISSDILFYLIIMTFVVLFVVFILISISKNINVFIERTNCSLNDNNPDFKNTSINYLELDNLYNNIELSIEEIERSRETKNIELIRAIDKLEQSLRKERYFVEKLKNTQKSSRNYLATINHDIKNPISGILMQLNLLLKSELNESQLDKCIHMKNASNQLLSLSNSILDTDRSESSDIAYDAEPTELIDLIERCIINAKSQVMDKPIEIYFFPHENIPNYIFIDGQWVERIISNLLSNAIKFSIEGDIFLSVESLNIKNDNKFDLRFSISDEGSGILPELEKTIFRKENDDFSENKGLGLMICKDLVDKMGGKIGFESSHNYGSLFWFEIPSRIHSFKSTTQKKISKEVRALNVNIAIYNLNPLFLYSLKAQFSLIDLNCSIYSDYKELLNNKDSYDIIIGKNLSDNITQIREIKSKNNIIISFEPEKIELDNQYVAKYIDYIIDIQTPLYRSAQRIIKIVEKSNMTFIGKKTLNPQMAIQNPIMNKLDGVFKRPLDGYQILIVDFNQYSQTAIKDMLEELGASAEISIDFIDYQNRINGNIYDVVITEFLLEDKTGEDALKEISLSIINKNTPAICITSDLSKKVRLINSLPFVCSISKPITENNLMKSIVQNKKIKINKEKNTFLKVIK